MKPNPKLTFSSYFNVAKKHLDEEGFFNLSLICDLPLFIDPFHLFYSDKKEYQELHDEIIKYLVFLKNLSVANGGRQPTQQEIDAYYRFPEVKQNWFGFTAFGNKGHGLGPKFARQLNTNFQELFSDFGVAAKPRHLEKLTLIANRVGKDTISDFTTNLIHAFLAKKTESFAKRYIDESKLGKFTVKRAEFDYARKAWIPKGFLLPACEGEYVLLTPRDLLTKNNTWINREDLIKNFEGIPYATSDAGLREQLMNYFNAKLKEHSELVENKKTKKIEPKVTAKTRTLAARETIREFPITIDLYVHQKEKRGDEAIETSEELVAEVEGFHEGQWTEFVNSIRPGQTKPTSYEEAHARAIYFKECIELHDLYKNLYQGDSPANEDWVQRMFRFVWYGAMSNIDRHPANGLGEPDYSISQGAKDKSLVEFKLASSSSLEENLLHQMKKYKEVEKASRGIWIVIFFTRFEQEKVRLLLEKHGLSDHPDYVVVDARKDNKIPPSKIKSTK